ncbi:DUF305 domain-containing protein [Actinomycetospora soli]|uniref:DUF305 domain-containing protein n=1 Tax=Actinomycetospora soli TaxID=2893887 RepID=UPI001E472C47|nr:DUF305 domain-containing protein [Actinomycetospora soli]MCD2191738.1 DUF305 domain-containing protein [Actinomycetospora soli]
MRTRLIGGVLAAATAAAVAAGCSSTSSAPAPTPAPSPSSSSAAAAAPVAPEHNAADVTFAQSMIPHHTQAITMSQLAPTRAASPEVKELATKIEQAQGPELNQMNAMLAAWGAPAPQPGSTAMPGMPGMPMGGMSMPGMMGEGQMQQLSSLSGAAFDQTFLQMMIEHHSGAIQMAQTELAQGQNPQAKQLAQAIIEDQQSEILEMQVLLARA